MKDKVVLVTGGARRVGAAICCRLHQQGARLVVHCRDSLADAQQLKQALEQERPDSVALLQADLLDTGTIPLLVDQAVRQFGRLDGLVNNASSFFPTPVGECTEQA